MTLCVTQRCVCVEMTNSCVRLDTERFSRSGCTGIDVQWPNHRKPRTSVQIQAGFVMIRTFDDGVAHLQPSRIALPTCCDCRFAESPSAANVGMRTAHFRPSTQSVELRRTSARGHTITPPSHELGAKNGGCSTGEVTPSGSSSGIFVTRRTFAGRGPTAPHRGAPARTRACGLS
jgi:hypothetical protein